MSKVIIVVMLLFSLTACAPSNFAAHLYNLDNGDVLNANYAWDGSGHGTITVTTPSGQVLTGEYSTISGMSQQYGTGTVNVLGSDGYAWATTQGFSVNQPGQQVGSAVVSGGGLVIDIVYAVDPWSGHGNGVGKDNHGSKYRVQF